MKTSSRSRRRPAPPRPAPRTELRLWGHGLSPHRAGDRPVADAIDGQGTGSSPRRRAHLDAAASPLVRDLKHVTDAFQANAPWVTGFLTLSHEDALRDALTGLRDLVVALDPALAHAVDDAGADVLARLGEIDRFDTATASTPRPPPKTATPG